MVKDIARPINQRDITRVIGVYRLQLSEIVDTNQRYWTVTKQSLRLLHYTTWRQPVIDLELFKVEGYQLVRRYQYFEPILKRIIVSLDKIL